MMSSISDSRQHSSAAFEDPRHVHHTPESLLQSYREIAYSGPPYSLLYQYEAEIAKCKQGAAKKEKRLRGIIEALNREIDKCCRSSKYHKDQLVLERMTSRVLRERLGVLNERMKQEITQHARGPPSPGNTSPSPMAAVAVLHRRVEARVSDLIRTPVVVPLLDAKQAALVKAWKMLPTAVNAVRQSRNLLQGMSNVCITAIDYQAHTISDLPDPPGVPKLARSICAAGTVEAIDKLLRIVRDGAIYETAEMLSRHASILHLLCRELQDTSSVPSDLQAADTLFRAWRNLLWISESIRVTKGIYDILCKMMYMSAEQHIFLAMDGFDVARHLLACRAVAIECRVWGEAAVAKRLNWIRTVVTRAVAGRLLVWLRYMHERERLTWDEIWSDLRQAGFPT